jgi:hypothetical protein
LLAEYVLRFIVGGLAVSAFSAIGDVFRPRSFAGLFGAAPSIAIATLMITVWKQGQQYAAIEGRSMIIGAVALCAYSIIVCRLMKRRQQPALGSSLVAMLAWLGVALGLNWLLLS